MKKKMASRTVRIIISEEDWKEVEEYLNSRPEIFKGAVYGKAIVEKVKRMK